MRETRNRFSAASHSQTDTGCRRSVGLVCLLLALAACGSGPAHAPGDDASTIAAVTDGPFGNLEALMKADHVPGVSIAVLLDYEVDSVAGFGYRRAGHAEPVTPDTLFRASSISKSVTAAIAFTLAQRGLLRLQESANSQLMSWQIPDSEHTRSSPVTVLNLLDHTGCVNRPPGGFGYEGEYPTTLQILNGAFPATNPPVQVECAPGTEIRYSNFGYLILQQLVEDVSHQPFQVLATDLVLQPCGMSSSTFQQPLPESLENRAAFPHDSEGKPEPRTYNPSAQGQGGLWSSPAELARFAVELMKARSGAHESAFSPDLVNQLLTPPHPGLEGGWFWGPGFVLLGNWGFMQAGSDPGFRSLMVAFPSLGSGLVIMTNGEEAELLQLRLLGNFLTRFILMPRFGRILGALLSVSLLLSALVVWPGACLISRLRKWRKGVSPESREARATPLLARLLAGLAALLLLGLIGLTGYYAFSPAGPIQWWGETVPDKVATTIAASTAFLALLLFFFSFRAWRDRFWGLKARIHFSLVSLAAAMLSIQCLDFLGLG